MKRRKNRTLQYCKCLLTNQSRNSCQVWSMENQMWQVNDSKTSKPTTCVWRLASFKSKFGNFIHTGTCFYDYPMVYIITQSTVSNLEFQEVTFYLNRNHFTYNGKATGKCLIPMHSLLRQFTNKIVYDMPACIIFSLHKQRCMLTQKVVSHHKNMCTNLGQNVEI